MKLTIFRKGTHTDSAGNTVEFTDADLQQLASNYNPAQHEAPLVIGHPKTNAPAYGWVKALEYKDSTLVAETQQIDENFLELVKAGRYKKISAAFYPPNEPSNPKPGGYYLRHVGFLGAQPPALKGLPQTEFTEAENYLFFEEDKTMPEEKSEAKETNTTKEDRAVLETKLAAFEEKQRLLEQKEENLKKKEATLNRIQYAQFVESLNGKVLPRHSGGLVDFLMNLEQRPITLEYAEEGEVKKMGSVEWFKSFLNELPQQVEYAELTGKDKDKDKDKDKLKIPESELEKYLKSQFKGKDKK